MLRNETTSKTFSAFVGEHEARLRHALTARFGLQVGRDAAADALAYGWEQNRGFSGRAAVWTSVDGITWSRVPHDDAVFGGEGNQWMNTVTAVGPGLVAVGGDWSSEVHAAAVWTSVDGITWSRVPHDVTVFGGTGNQRMHSVTVAGAGLIAVGADGGFNDTRPDAAVWTSVDGLTWSRVAHDEAGFGGAEMHSVTVARPGLVAVGAGGLVCPDTCRDESLERKEDAERQEAFEAGDSVFVWLAEPED